ncbi:MAG: YggS family pyridoxal phosphate-dependent enzyme [Algicola sp.]|nr:YggS family pyridoxal phosphate-dependent enzyme [Algicola sp.]
MINIAQRLQSAYADIKEIARKHHRDENSVDLLAVSKTKPLELIVDAYQQGHRKFGENYAVEAAEKVEQLKDYKDIEWHFIGPIQSNKTRLLCDSFDWVHSIDRQKIAQRLNDQRSDQLSPMNVLIQVNVDNEEAKAGVSLDEVAALANAIAQMPKLKLRGIMAIPQKTQDPEQQNLAFSRLHDCFSQLKTQYTDIDTLSMGMTADLDAAIAQGSTMVRLGTAIFGARES